MSSFVLQFPVHDMPVWNGLINKQANKSILVEMVRTRNWTENGWKRSQCPKRNFGHLETWRTIAQNHFGKKKESLASCNQNKKKWVVTHNKWCHICPFFEFNLYLYVIVAWGAVTPYESTSLELIMLCLAHQFRRVTWRRGCVLQLWFVQYSTIDLLQLLKSLFLCSIISIRMAYCITSCVH